MLTENLKQKSLDELQVLLDSAHRNLVLAREYKQGAVVVQQNKIQLERVQQAIVEKRSDAKPIKK